uniref:CUB domain-containing protein n=1 Tax=Ciona savignyi TaxID=51511 RepID=H2YSI1_CIOSA
SCWMGNCDGESCICNDGWSGSQCDHCDGRILLEEDTGWLSDGLGNYATKSKCSWLIDPKNSTLPLRFFFHEFTSECGWDYLYIYDGDSAHSPLLATLNGIIYSPDQSGGYRPEIIATSGKAFLHFYSDVAYTMSGFNMSYSVNRCTYDCFNHGVCNGKYLFFYSQCICDNGWHGTSCQTQTCPNNCMKMETLGKDCSITLPNSKGFWSVSNFNPISISPRASYAAALIGNLLWVYGGMEFGSSRNQDLLVFNISSQIWKPVSNAGSNLYPQSRYGHTMIAHNNSLYIFGGKLTQNENSVDHLWEFNILTSSWTKINYSTDFSQVTNGTSGLELSGHSANLVHFNNDTEIMVVMFGYHPLISYSPFVYEYNFITKTWIRPQTSSAGLIQLYGHTTVQDESTNVIYIHGGAKNVGNSLEISSSTYSYNPQTRCFTQLKNSKQPRFLHSAGLVNGVMYIYGGNTHNDTNESGALCYSPSFMAYSIACNSWSHLNSTPDSINPSRYGHFGIVVKSISQSISDNIFIFSGYDGMMINDVLIYQPGNCIAVQDKNRCLGKLRYKLHRHEGNNHHLSLNVKCIPNLANAKPSNVFFASNLIQGNPCDQTELSCYWNTTHCIARINNSSTCLGDNLVQTPNCSRAVKCADFKNCIQCITDPECMWSKTCIEYNSNETSEPCETSCADLKSCSNCLKDSSCMWCQSQYKCINTNSYVVQYPYGQCLEWTNKNQCPVYKCSDLKTCGECQDNPNCGWCDDGSYTGLGVCMDGGGSGPLLFNNSTAQYEVSSEMCPSGWFFTSCPLCQCNGHSSCDSNNLCINCTANTIGDQCQNCKPGFYGDPRNGNNCTKCSCGTKAVSCNSQTGACNCETKGETGRSCEVCDTSNGYTGNAAGNGTCFYTLLINYQFTFNLKMDADDTHVTKINFKNTPNMEEDVQVTFVSTQMCDLHFAVSSVTTKNLPGGEESILYVENTTDYSFTFSGDRLKIGDPGQNTTVRVYVSGFKTPTLIKISLLQRSNRLLKILLILFSSFLVVLLLAAVTWKLKMMYDVRQLQANRAVEMAEMAARPFAAIQLCCDDMYRSTQVSDGCEIGSMIHNPEAVCEENCSNSKVSVVSVFLWLPTGLPSEEKLKNDANLETPPYYVAPPPGQCGLAIGTALIHGCKSDQATPQSHKKKIDVVQRNNNSSRKGACV